MKVIKLLAENILRLVAVNISPTGHVVTISGKNGAGKSSVLDAIAMALGGADLCPTEPIRNGETNGKVVVDLGDYVVTRKFSRQRLPTDYVKITLENSSPDVVKHIEALRAAGKLECDALDHNEPEGCSNGLCWKHPNSKFGPTNSALVVTNKDGARYPSPQSILDKLVSDLSFDPLEFASAKDPAAILRRLDPSLDMSDLDEAKDRAFVDRAAANREVKTLEAQLAGLPFHESLPVIEVSVANLAEKLDAANEAARAIDALQQGVNQKQRAAAEAAADVSTCETALRNARLAVAKAEAALKSAEQRAADLAKVSEQAVAARKAAGAPPDTAPIKRAIADAESINAKIRANVKRAETAKKLEAAKATAAAHQKTLDDLAARRASRIAAAKLPVPGLAIDEAGHVTLDGLPFAQASTAAKVRASAAIGFALNPTLRVLLIKRGNDLDDDNLALLADLAAQADGQVWLEAIHGGDQAVVIEDGAIKTGGRS